MAYTRPVRLELDLALSILRRRRGALLRSTAAAAFAGIVTATAALVLTLALMTGYRREIAAALGRGGGHMVAFLTRRTTLEEARALARRAAAVPGVRRAEPVAYVTALAEDPADPAHPVPVVLKATLDPPAFTGLGRWPEGAAPAAVPGARLAERLGLSRGDTLVVSLPPRPGSWTVPRLALQVAGTFHLAFAEFDESWVAVPLGPLLRRRPELEIGGLELALDDPLHPERIRPAVEAALPGALVTDWREMNGALFAALRWQTVSLFVVLSLVVAVAAFQVSSALVVLAAGRRRSTGMLLAMGAHPGIVRRTLFLAGTLLGGAGVAVGLAAGATMAAAATALRVVRFPPELARVYMVEFIPFRVTPSHAAAVAAMGLLLVALAAYWPARRAATLEPVRALRAV